MPDDPTGDQPVTIIEMPNLPAAPEARVLRREGTAHLRKGGGSRGRYLVPAGPGEEISFHLGDRCIRRYVLPSGSMWPNNPSEYANLWFADLRDMPATWQEKNEDLQLDLVARGNKPGCCIRVRAEHWPRIQATLSKLSLTYEVFEARCDAGFFDIFAWQREGVLLGRADVERTQAVLDFWRAQALAIKLGSGIKSPLSRPLPSISVIQLSCESLRDAARAIEPVLQAQPTKQAPLDLLRCALFFGYPIKAAAALLWFRRLTLVCGTGHKTTSD